MNITSLAKKALTIAAASAALMTLGTGSASADQGSGYGGWGQTRATCFDHRDTMGLSVHISTDSDHDQQQANFAAFFYRYNSSTGKWDYVQRYMHNPFYTGYTPQVVAVKLTPGYYFVQVYYNWRRGSGSVMRGETVPTYVQEDAYRRRTAVNSYCLI